MSLLAHIVTQTPNLAAEPAATQTLGYILGASPELATSLTDLLWPDVGFDVGHVETERRFGGFRPDLTIFDNDRRHRVFVENKFWAGLTDAQPVQYLHALRDDLPSGLVFILPEQRIPTVWDELKRRSRGAYKLGNESPLGRVARLQMGSRTMCATSWRYVLDSLEQISPNDDVRRDVLQLRGLAKFGESDRFPPLRGDELSDVTIPRRMIEYGELIENIVGELKLRGVADTEGLGHTRTWDEKGCYCRVLEQFGIWIGVALEPWKNFGITPLWIKLFSTEWGNLGEYYDRLDNHPEFEKVQDGKDGKYFPIRLRTGVEKDEVIGDATDQVERMAWTLRKLTGRIVRTVETQRT